MAALLNYSQAAVSQHLHNYLTSIYCFRETTNRIGAQLHVVNRVSPRIHAL